MVLYLAYVRPFANMIYNQITAFPNSDDSDYIFCSFKSPAVPWDGRVLSKTLQVASQAKLGVKINIWAYRQIVIGIARVHLKSIAPFWEKNDKRCHQLLLQDTDRYIYAWQATHQLVTNTLNYGLDHAYPSHLQPELLREYRRISLAWHHWLGLIPALDEAQEAGSGPGPGPEGGKRKRDDEPRTPPRKSRKLVDRTAQTTPSLNRVRAWDADVQDSPTTRKLKEVAAAAKKSMEEAIKRMKEATKVVEMRREEKALRERLLNDGV
jgi:hypothetical protein